MESKNNFMNYSLFVIALLITVVLISVLLLTMFGYFRTDLKNPYGMLSGLALYFLMTAKNIATPRASFVNSLVSLFKAFSGTD